jgi:H+/Cl- antiporter ClcA
MSRPRGRSIDGGQLTTAAHTPRGAAQEVPGMARASVGSPRPPRHTGLYPGLLLKAAVLGVITGLFGILFLGATKGLTNLVWPSDWDQRDWFSGSVWTVAIPLAAGLFVGVVHRAFHLQPKYPSFIDDLREGHVETDEAAGAVGISVVSLVGGASLGPEGPLGATGGAIGTWLARRSDDADEEDVRQFNFVGISGAFGGLLSTPIGGPLLAFELGGSGDRGHYYNMIVPGVIAGSLSFAVMFPVIGAPFSGLAAIPGSDFHSWMLLVAFGLGILGVVAAFIVGKLMVAITTLMQPLDDRPVLRGAIGGAALAVIAFTLPLTLFSGETALPTIVDNYQDFGVGILLAMFLFKAAALGISLGSGFYGGPVFPIFFMGTTLGIAVNALFPDLPLVLTVPAMMAALGSAMALIPLAMAVLAAIVVSLDLELSGAVLVASTTAFAIRIILSQREHAESGDMQRASTGRKAA